MTVLKPVADLANLTELFATAEIPTFGEIDAAKSRANGLGDISS